MHDFLLTKEIIDKIIFIAQEKGLEKIKSVTLEIGTGSVPHDHKHEHMDDEHFDELNIENVQFGLGAISKKTILENIEFKINKIEGNEWKIVNIEV